MYSLIYYGFKDGMNLDVRMVVRKSKLSTLEAESTTL